MFVWRRPDMHEQFYAAVGHMCRGEQTFLQSAFVTCLYYCSSTMNIFESVNNILWNIIQIFKINARK